METITNNLFSVDLLNQPGADLMLGFATKLLAGIVTIVIGFWLASRASRLVVDSISKIDRIDKTIMPMIGALVRYAGMILTLVVALGKFGVETTSIIAVLGAAGLAIGLATLGGRLLLFVGSFARSGTLLLHEGIIGKLIVVFFLRVFLFFVVDRQ